jgi:hypothetical protein
VNDRETEGETLKMIPEASSLEEFFSIVPDAIEEMDAMMWRLVVQVQEALDPWAVR